MNNCYTESKTYNKNMKTKIISIGLLIFLIIIPTKAQTWEFVGLDSMIIRQLYVFGDTIYAGTAVRNGYNINAGLYVSTNSGLNWVQLDSSLGDGAIIGLEFFNENKNSFYLIKGSSPASNGGNLFRTTNSGINWEIITQLEGIGLNWVRISAYNNNEIYVRESHFIPSGWFATVYRSLDGGNNWEEITSSFPGSSHGRRLSFNLSLLDSTILYASVFDELTSTYFFKSTNRGNSWLYISAPQYEGQELIPDQNIRNRIFIFSGNYLTTDEGYTWMVVDSGLAQDSYYLSSYQHIKEPDKLFTLRIDGLYYLKRDSVRWQRVEGSENLPLAYGIGGFTPSYVGSMKNIFIDNESKILYVGTGYGIYKKANISDVDFQTHTDIHNFKIEQNYPNPFNPTTIILYYIPMMTHITIKVYDLLGNEIETLVAEEKQPGEYQIEFNGSELTSGVYFYVLTAVTENGIKIREGKKMLLVK